MVPKDDEEAEIRVISQAPAAWLGDIGDRPYP